MCSDALHFEISNGTGWITLGRPLLDLDLLRAMSDSLRRCANDPAVAVVVVRGRGDGVFCSGLDPQVIHAALSTGGHASVGALNRERGHLERSIKTFPKPYIAFLNGAVLGSGAGLAVHGSHRVGTDLSTFALPETGVGLPVDGGGTYFLPRCPGRVGLYLALTGDELGAADMLEAGLSTHFIPNARLPELKVALSKIIAADDVPGAVTCVLDAYHEGPGVGRLHRIRSEIDACFGRKSVEDILTALEENGNEWALSARARMLARSPFALKTAFRQMQVGPLLEFDRAIILEYRLSQRFMEESDYQEGIRSTLKGNETPPQWTPATLAAVSADRVDAFFKPLGGGDLFF